MYTIFAAAAAKSLQLCPTLCNPIEGSPPGSAIPGIFQARTLEWGAIAFSVQTSQRGLIYPVSYVRAGVPNMGLEPLTPSGESLSLGYPILFLGHSLEVWVLTRSSPSPSPDSGVLSLQPWLQKSHAAGFQVFLSKSCSICSVDLHMGQGEEGDGKFWFFLL